ncbi:hypothetical protein F4780DRAFT_735736 [Xylariomycetidae sp. FL0641]|nr:hypothetical protein F4780DRAFT_735736 [Xylariomycetidae sp. FL0641]
MLASLLFTTVLGASSVIAAPTWPTLMEWSTANPDGLKVLSEYFNLLASKIDIGKALTEAPVCDMSLAAMPQAPEAMATPDGLKLKHVAVGRGTQNYTCDVTNATAEPELIGAKATLFNASCVAASYPDVLTMLPKVALQFNLSDATLNPANPAAIKLGPTSLDVSGHHFFTNATTPFFDLGAVGQAPCSKKDSVDAPADAPTGQQGEAAVSWLRLSANPDASGNIKAVYRVQTAGGSAPKVCAGLPASFEVQYSAQYWFWESE